MAKKQRKPTRAKRDNRIHKAHPKAISLRNSGPGLCTTLFDENHLGKFIQEKEDLAHVLLNQSPKTTLNKIEGWAGQGHWLSFQTHPEIMDADGVPHLDIVFVDKYKSQTPDFGHWYDPVVQTIDLSSGKLRVVYNEEFWESDFNRDASTYQLNSSRDEDLNSHDFLEASSYTIDCLPGIYRAHVISRFREGPENVPECSADSVIYFEPTNKPKQRVHSPALLPLHPEGQDVDALRRKAFGRPPQKQIKIKPRVSQGIFHGVATTDPYSPIVNISASLQQEFGCTGGEIWLLDIEGQKLHVFSQDEKSPVHDPIYQQEATRRAKEFDNVAVIIPGNAGEDRIALQVLKQSRKNPLNFEPDGLAKCTLSKILDDEGRPLQFLKPKSRKKKSSAKKSSKNRISKKAGQVGEAYTAILSAVEKCFHWSQQCIVDVDGKSVELALSLYPPSENQKSGMAEATVIRHTKKTQSQEEKRFRKFPGCGERALQWLISKVEGGFFIPTSCKLDIDYFGVQRPMKTDKRSLKKKSIEVWKEAMGFS